MIWFYPLNELEISGYETFVVALFSPVLAGIPAVRRGLSNRWVVAVLRLLTLASVASFQMSTTLHRLIALAFGCFSVMLVLTASLWSGSQYQRYGIALLCQSVSRIDLIHVAIWAGLYPHVPHPLILHHVFRHFVFSHVISDVFLPSFLDPPSFSFPALASYHLLRDILPFLPQHVTIPSHSCVEV